jgi:hypothetical protein
MREMLERAGRERLARGTVQGGDIFRVAAPEHQIGEILGEMGSARFRALLGRFVPAGLRLS